MILVAFKHVEEFLQLTDMIRYDQVDGFDDFNQTWGTFLVFPGVFQIKTATKLAGHIHVDTEAQRWFEGAEFNEFPCQEVSRSFKID